MKTCPECHGKFQDTISKCPQDNIELKSDNVNPLIGSRLADRYLIVSLLGSGGTGIVYKAQHIQMERAVAIKMMHAHMVTRPDALRKFYDEAKLIAQLKHHNIVTLYDFGISSTNQPFLAMDYIDGPNLKKYVENEGPVSFDQMRIIAAQAIDGLAYAHAEGLVHQDLKPENIMLTDGGPAGSKVFIVDFGLATLASDKELIPSENKKKQFIGSPYYMSPEQCLSNAMVDARSDIYSLAIVFYEALSNNLPYEKKSAMAMLDNHVREKPNLFKNSNPDLVGLQSCTEVTKVFSKAMAKNPNERYQDIKEFGVELDDALARDSVKLKAIKHRSLAAEKAFVHARETFQSTSALNIKQFEIPKSYSESGCGFLHQQADIEEVYLNKNKQSIEGSDSAPIHLKITHSKQKRNTIIRLFSKLANSCRATQNKIAIPNTNTSTNICPNCKIPSKQGIQFCLNCQRPIFPSTRPVKLSDARNVSSLTYHGLNDFNVNEQREVKNKLQNLRQQKIVGSGTIALIKLQRYLNYALILAIIVGGMVVIQRYVLTSQLWRNQNNINSDNRPVKSLNATKSPDYTKNYLDDQN